MATVCFQFIVYADDYVLRQAVEAVQPYGEVVVVEGPVQYWQNHDRQKERQRQRAMDILHDLLPDQCIRSGKWVEKDAMQAAAGEMTPPGTTHVWVVDADEVWKPEHIEKVIERLDGLDSVAFKARSFFAGFDHYMTGFEREFAVHRIQRWHDGARWATHRPPTVLAPDGKPYSEHRHWSHHDTAALGLEYYHYSYVWPLQTLYKWRYYHARAPGMNIPEWYETVWFRWATAPAEREQIEREHCGVHNWLPHLRGDCYTSPLGASCHPQSMRDAMPELLHRWNAELLEVM
jgi:hypothetical protein